MMVMAAGASLRWQVVICVAGCGLALGCTGSRQAPPGAVTVDAGVSGSGRGANTGSVDAGSIDAAIRGTGGIGAAASGAADDDAGANDATTAGSGAAGMVGPKPAPLEVRLDDGVIEGFAAGATRQFLGIPYAKAPTGALRFAPPERVATWTGVRAAKSFGPDCPQPKPSGSHGEIPADQSEDCLSLNVYLPEASSAEPFAVMVFVHGGSFITGAGREYDGSQLAAKRGVIVVTLNYRLGALGLLIDPSLDAAFRAPSGNQSIRDQQLALEWVQRNIARFGGDPNNVTLFGESAGSTSACVHLFARGSERLAHRFILESGGCVESAIVPMTRSSVARTSSAFVQSFCAGASDVLACLRSVPVVDLVAWTNESGSAADAGTENSPDPLGEGFRPHVDGVLVEDDPRVLLAAGDFLRVPLLIGTNLNEMGRFPDRTAGADSVLSFTLFLVASYPATWLALAPIYSPATDAGAHAAFLNLTNDTWFRCPSRALARGAAAHGSPVYLYSFDLPPAVHTQELDYVFGAPIVGPTITSPPQPTAAPVPPLPSLVDAVQGYWTAFAKTGDPNGADLPNWPRYAAASDQHLVLDTQLRVNSGLAKQGCDAWTAALSSAP